MFGDRLSSQVFCAFWFDFVEIPRKDIVVCNKGKKVFTVYFNYISNQ